LEILLTMKSCLIKSDPAKTSPNKLYLLRPLRCADFALQSLHSTEDGERRRSHVHRRRRPADSHGESLVAALRAKRSRTKNKALPCQRQAGACYCAPPGDLLKGSVLGAAPATKCLAAKTPPAISSYKTHVGCHDLKTYDSEIR
jgi:hypothetical protein